MFSPRLVGGGRGSGAAEISLREIVIARCGTSASLRTNHRNSRLRDPIDPSLQTRELARGARVAVPPETRILDLDRDIDAPLTGFRLHERELMSILVA